ncbi:MAG: site-specific integrase [Fuerstiella sp.]|nr:site-specific integrase [Fuerstiella sp.]MCP4853435.1 site-specific integrase [Fuerstiella sp.]
MKVDQKQDGSPVFASANDLRRAFGDRWAKIVPPMILKDLMRHASVTTTEQYCVSVNAKSTMEQLRKFQKAAEVPLEVPPTKKRHPKVSSNQQKQRAADET